MRAIFLVSILLAAPAFAHDHATSGHEKTPAAPVPAHTGAHGDVYGAAIPEPLPPPVTIDAVAVDVSAHAGKPQAFTGRITQVCQKQGCWLVLTGDGGEFARVAMHDHAFSVPKDAKGTAVVYGTLSEKVHSDAEIQHLKKDGAKAPEPRELSIDATSVLILKAG